MPKECSVIHEDTFSTMFKAALFIIGRKWKKIHMSTNQRMEKENMVHLSKGILINCRKSKVMRFADKWIKLEKNHPE